LQSNRIPRAEQSEFGAAARGLDECDGAVLDRHMTRRPHGVGKDGAMTRSAAARRAAMLDRAASI